MLEELTTLMHSEFTINKATEIKHKAGCVWTVVGFDANEEKLVRECKSYGITVAQANRWKKYWMEKMTTSKTL